jgi:hypothetical protein
MNEDDEVESDVVVKYLVACTRATKPFDRPDDPYTLHEVRFSFAVPAENEWPVRLTNLWLFVRFYSGSGTRTFTVAVVWVDPSDGEERELCFYDWTVTFREGDLVHERISNVSAVRFPGPGRYAFRMIDDRTGAQLAEEYIFIWRTNETETER